MRSKKKLNKIILRKISQKINWKMDQPLENFFVRIGPTKVWWMGGKNMQYNFFEMPRQKHEHFWTLYLHLRKILKCYIILTPHLCENVEHK